MWVNVLEYFAAAGTAIVSRDLSLQRYSLQKANAMEDYGNEGNDWAWQVGDESFNFKSFPQERLPLPPLTVVQGRYAKWNNQIEASWVPDLNSKLLSNMEREVARIKMGDNFTSIKQFDCCLDNWCVLNRCKTHHVKWQKTYVLCVCPFGPRVRPPWRRDSNNANAPPPGPTVDL